MNAYVLGRTMRQLIDQIILVLLVTGIFATSPVVANDRLSADRLAVPDFVDIQTPSPEYRQATFNFSVPVEVSNLDSSIEAVAVTCLISASSTVIRGETTLQRKVVRVATEQAANGTRQYSGEVDVSMQSEVNISPVWGDSSYDCALSFCTSTDASTDGTQAINSAPPGCGTPGPFDNRETRYQTNSDTEFNLSINGRLSDVIQ